MPDILERERVPDSLWSAGLNSWGLRDIAARSGMPVTVSGIPPMPYLTFNPHPADKEKTYRARREYFYTQTIRRGLFVQPYHHWYIAHRHTDADLEKALEAIDEALELTARRFPVGS